MAKLSRSLSNVTVVCHCCCGDYNGSLCAYSLCMAKDESRERSLQGTISPLYPSYPSTFTELTTIKLASETRHAITTFKAISFTYSAVGSRVSFNQGNATGQNNDLWSWSCSAQADAMSSVNQSSSNCLTSVSCKMTKRLS